jgi:putative transposase
MEANKTTYAGQERIYHIVFLPKPCYIKTQADKSGDIIQLIKRVATSKGAAIIEASAFCDHVYICLKLPPQVSMPRFMEYLKSKTSLMLFDEQAKSKYVYRNRLFWCQGYCLSADVPRADAVQRYIYAHSQPVSRQAGLMNMPAPAVNWMAECR